MDLTETLFVDIGLEQAEYKLMVALNYGPTKPVRLQMIKAIAHLAHAKLELWDYAMEENNCAEVKQFILDHKGKLHSP